MLETLNKPNVKNIALEEAETRQGFFNPKKDLRPDWFQEVKEEIESTTVSFFNGEEFRNLIHAQLLAPERKDEITLTNTHYTNLQFYINKEKQIWANDQDPFSAERYIKFLAAQHLLSPETVDHEEVNKVVKVFAESGHALMAFDQMPDSPIALKLLRPDAHVVFDKAVALSGIKNLYGHVQNLPSIVVPSTSRFLTHLNSVRLFLPDEDFSFYRSFDKFRRYKKTLDQALEEEDFNEYLTIAWHLTMLSADKIQVDEDGIKLIYEKPLENPKTLPYPEMDRTELKKGK